MKTKIYIDGSEGTTGLRIMERFQNRTDIELLTIPSELRKDLNERKKYINASDITFLCLPDDAAREAVSLVENDNVRIIDASTAHRTLPDWSYGFPELSATHRENIKNGKRIAVPGCYATGFISLVYPMIAEGLMPADYPVSAFGLSGYSGAGKKVIAAYEAEERPNDYNAPREYALTQQHKHLKEMKKIPGLEREPLFSPIICDYYSGMVMTVPVYTHMLNKAKTLNEVHAMFSKFYEGQRFVKVMPLDAQAGEGNMLAGNACSGWDGLRIFITGNDERIVLSSQFDNLGKGASGAAIQCMNIMLGIDEATGLNL
ncbi:MAG: N-acetyl-gamma-glutamyl-phosphate reductase [Lachnospiraceae bacterium]|nr:N-acetyl-gamma-glutamyl-phosphate reductase [Lachnospiraceae bacterium]